MRRRLARTVRVCGSLLLCQAVHVLRADQYGITNTYRETSGGHTWINWRDYLAEFAPLLFR